MKKLIFAACALFLVAGCSSNKAPAEIYTAGTYEATGSGHGGKVTVSVELSASEIVSVEVVDHSESAGISDPAIEQIPAAIVEAQSADVDSVAGATRTSNAIKNAVATILEENAK